MKKLTKDIFGFTAAGIGLGAGAKIATDVSAGTGITVTGGISSMSTMMPALGSVVGAGHVMRKTMSMIPKGYRRKRK